MLIEEVYNWKKDASLGIENTAGRISKNLFLLDAITERAKNLNIFSKVTNDESLVQDVAKEIKLAGRLETYSLCQYNENPDAAKDITNSLGKITQTRMHTTNDVQSSMSEKYTEVPLVEEVPKDQAPKKSDGAAATITPNRYPRRSRKQHKWSIVPQKSPAKSPDASVTPEPSDISERKTTRS